MNKINAEGEHINNYTVINRIYKKNNSWYYRCICDCCNEFDVLVSDIYKVKSCGCMKRKLISEGKIKHGGWGTKLYRTWRAMKARCYNPNNKDYADYGGRGIIVCNEWLENFGEFKSWAYENGYEEMSAKGRCSIDRINVDGNYEPSNCRWADDVMQANNRRSNTKLTYNGETHTGTEWARIRGTSETMVLGRLKLGWDIGKAIETPKVYDKERSLNMILDILKNNETVTYVDLTTVCTKCLVLKYIKELIKRGYNITSKKELRKDNGKSRWYMTFRLEV